MSETLRSALGRLNSIPEHVLLWINVGLACFIVLAHGGALAVTYSKPTPDAEDIRQLAMVSLPIAAFVIVTSAAALIRAGWRRQVLGAQGVFLVGSSVAMLYWAMGILLRGIPEGNFSWSPGFMSAWVWYSFLVFCRFGLPNVLRSPAVTSFVPLAILAVSIPIDIGVFIRLMSLIGDRFGF